MDIEILYAWKSLGIPVPFIMDVMFDLADECLSRKQAFPASLVPIDRRVRNRMRALSEFA